ncbi:hypothetical protein jhhlp_004523 [Lomentospora prolificans]|uniref:Something about silencing protein 4 domain-containing protein n=1 Tax=Lomentospora prolificans TaxID=41688 RepID=A0A2N3NBT1_9PEZI|nr:hypothetical protein jhhlp_004523 [Lomentospora prolificans]
MATLTRSSRRPEDNALHHHHVGRPTAKNNHLMATSAARANSAAAGLAAQSKNILSRGASGRVKRSHDAADCDSNNNIDPKRSRITVDIPARTVNGGAARPVDSAGVVGSGVAPQKGAGQAQRSRSQKQQAVQRAERATAADPRDDDDAAPDRKTTATKPSDKQSKQESLKNNTDKPTKHQEKVRNGIQHELDKLQPAPSDTKPEGRKLRSQETIRFKSELSTYFPEYDEVIGNDPKQTYLLNLETPIIVVDSITSFTELDAINTNSKKRTFKEFSLADSVPFDNLNVVRHFGDALFDDLYDSQRIDFGFLEARLKKKLPENPLPDSCYEPAHKKAERLEKSIRNRERGRAQHERDRIIRLLDGLQGHDWLRIMGVSGITESRKKSFEPARDYFIKGCQGILDKFRRWTLEEKRRKQERERKEREQSELAATVQSRKGSTASATSAQEDEGASVGDNASVVSDPNSDVDASIAKQLQEEALARARVASDMAATNRSTATLTKAGDTKKQPAKRTRGKTVTNNAPTSKSAANKTATSTKKPPESEPSKSFTSFFQKKHERDAALSRGRRSGRKILAWGHPLPEMPEADFELPGDIKDPEIMKAQARKKRRDKRATKA